MGAMNLGAMNWESVFTLLETNAARVPTFRKFVQGEPLSPIDLQQLEIAARQLGLYDFARLVGQTAPDVLQCMAKAHESIAQAERVKALWEAFIR
jgi:hypothetical protein